MPLLVLPFFPLLPLFFPLCLAAVDTWIEYRATAIERCRYRLVVEFTRNGEILETVRVELGILEIGASGIAISGDARL